MPTVEELLDALMEMVEQHCTDSQYIKGGDFDSFALSANAIALRLLAEAGRVKIVREVGRRVIAIKIEEKSDAD